MSAQSARAWYAANKERRRLYSHHKNRTNRRRYEPHFKPGVLCACGRPAQSNNWWCSPECLRACQWAVCELLVG